MSLFTKVLRLMFVLLLLSTISISAEPPRYTRSIHEYTPPDVVLINQDGERVRLKELLETDQPVVVDFIYGTCTTICPILSAGYTHLQRKLGTDSSEDVLVYEETDNTFYTGLERSRSGAFIMLGLPLI